MYLFAAAIMFYVSDEEELALIFWIGGIMWL